MLSQRLNRLFCLNHVSNAVKWISTQGKAPGPYVLNGMTPSQTVKYSWYDLSATSIKYMQKAPKLHHRAT